MKFSKTKSTTLLKKYGIYYDSIVKTLVIMWNERRFYILF